MKKFALILLAFAAAALLFAQQQKQSNPPRPAFETMAVFPPETSPGHYAQVEQHELQNLADQGWELVGVAPYVYRNEERGSDHPKAVVMQTYPAYFFKRLKANRY